MVLPILLGLGFVALLFTFRNQISGFINDLKAGKTEEQIAQTALVETRGAIPNTIAFLTGEQGLNDFNEFDKALDAAFLKGVTDIQNNFDKTVVGVNQTLADAQANLENFAKDAQTNIQDAVDSAIKNTSDFFAGFGGQSEPKPVITTVEPNPVIQTQSGQTFDLSFLTPVDVLEQNKILGTQTVTSNEVKDLSESRFSGSGSLR